MRLRRSCRHCIVSFDQDANEPEELYDLLADPEELTNLAFDPQRSATVKNLRAATMAELKRTGAKMVDSLPPVANALASE